MWHFCNNLLVPQLSQTMIEIALSIQQYHQR